MSRVRAAPVLLAVAVLWPATEAAAHPQASARLATGGGAAFASDAQTDGVFEMAVRSELLFGADEVRAFRIGPALDLRTADFVTAEAAGGVAALLPIATGFPLLLTAAAGWASRPDDVDGAFALGTLAWGYRSYNHHHVYGFGLQVYASTRVDLDDTSRWQVTAGVEIDLLFLVAIPSIFLWELITSGDPE